VAAPIYRMKSRSELARSALLLLSLTAGVALMAGIATLADIKINFCNFIVYPIMFGIAVDYGGNVLSRMAVRRNVIAGDGAGPPAGHGDARSRARVDVAAARARGRRGRGCDANRRATTRHGVTPRSTSRRRARGDAGLGSRAQRLHINPGLARVTRSWGSAMSIVLLEHADDTVLAVQDGFGANDGGQLHELLLRIGRERAITIDFREVRGIEDFVLARLAPEFARRPMRVLGLSDHQHRILHYFASESGRDPHEHRTPSPGAERGLSAGGGVPVVLVVGDDADFRTMLSELLAAEGYQVREAANTSAAMRRITDDGPSVVLLDCAMSSAPMVLERLRRDGVAARVPVVVISDEQLPPPGAIACLHEPVERGALSATLKSVQCSVTASEAKTS
jgi:CheY-like chemotaxis protein